MIAIVILLIGDVARAAPPGQSSAAHQRALRNGRIMIFTGLGTYCVVALGGALFGVSEAKGEPPPEVGVGLVIGGAITATTLVITGAAMVGSADARLPPLPPPLPENARLIRRGRIVALSSLGGFALAGGGLALVLAEPDCQARPCMGEWGLGLVSIGMVGAVTLITTGASMVAVGGTRERKRLVAVPSPMIFRHGIGIGWTGRF